MSVRKIGAKVGVAGLAASAIGLAVIAPAMAAYTSAASNGDYLPEGSSGATYAAPNGTAVTPAATDLVGVGSDTIQFVIGDLAKAYNATAGSTGHKLASYGAGAVDPGTLYPVSTTASTIKLADGSTPTRPNGSGAGLNALQSTTDLAGVAFARTSSGPEDGGAQTVNGHTNGLVWYPFAVDSLVAATAPGGNAPASLTGAQLLSIYKGDVTNWSQLGGKDGAIVPLIPQASSGTGKFFISQLTKLNGGVALANSGKGVGVDTDDKIPGTNKSVQEHDPTVLKNDPNAVVPFSGGRAGFFGSSLVKVESGWKADRAVYSVLRSKDTSGKAQDNPAWFSGAPLADSIFGPTGYFCSAAARSVIEAAGFSQLKSVADNGACGVGISDTTPPSLAAYTTTTTTPPATGGGTTKPALGTAGNPTPVTGVTLSKIKKTSKSFTLTFAAPVKNAVDAKVKVYDGKKLIGTVTVTNGKATVKLKKKLKKGTHKIKVALSASKTSKAFTKTVSVKVK
ncbi:substrate-binding domain-containing protein [Nocardioides sp.]|uniref:PstS family phosphate ABC transporter substrate-binding protein n=1 Tax=Nocardioides sp. TaxID=35761 RepID=UPI002635A896|nr:substrate-binding domain-containing protein [Nocardioides sp.]